MIRPLESLHRFVRRWGATDEDVAKTYPCERFVPEPHDVSVRAIDIDAPKEIVWRWLCQMATAPYSYDWLDNAGMKSPPELTPGLDQLVIGQEIMKTRPWCIFELVDFERDSHITMQVSPRARFVVWNARTFWGIPACSYVVEPRGDDRCRVRVKVVGRARGGLLQRLRNVAFPTVEAFMMRRQLLNFKALAERDVRRAGSARGARRRPPHPRRAQPLERRQQPQRAAVDGR
jgi:hypothetical protein